MASTVDSKFARSSVFANWVCSIQRIGAARHIAVGAVDDAAVPLLDGLGLHPVPMARAVAEFVRGWAVDGGPAQFWSYIQKVKPLLALAALLAQLGVLMLDTDMVLFSDPLSLVARELAAAAAGAATGVTATQDAVANRSSSDRGAVGPEVLCQADHGGDSARCCTGFIYFAPTPDVLRRVWQWVGVMQQLLLVDCTQRGNKFCHLPEQSIWNNYVMQDRHWGGDARPSVVPPTLPTVPAGGGGPPRVLVVSSAEVGPPSTPVVRPSATAMEVLRTAVRLPRVALHAAGGAGPWSGTGEGKERMMRAHRAWLPRPAPAAAGGGGADDPRQVWECDTSGSWPPSTELVWDPGCVRVPGCVPCTWCATGVTRKWRLRLYSALNGTALCEAALLPPQARPAASDSNPAAGLCPLPPVPAELAARWAVKRRHTPPPLPGLRGAFVGRALAR